MIQKQKWNKLEYVFGPYKLLTPAELSEVWKGK